MGPNTLDNLDSPSFSDELVPFQFRKEKTETGTHEWLKHWFERSYEKAYPRYVMYRRYINMYKNLDEWEGDGLAKTSSRNAGVSKKKTRVRDNIVYSFTEQRVAQVSKKKVSLTFVPRVHTSQQDLNATKATKLLVRARHEEMDFDGQMIRMDRVTYLLGHALYQVDWDDNTGPLAPSYVKAKAKAEGGKKLVDPETGEEFDLTKPIRIGDTKGKLWKPYEWFPEEGKSRHEELDYIQTHEWMTIQLVEAKYPKAKEKIKSSEYVKWDFSSQSIERPNNEIMIRTFWHKPTEFFPEGCKIVWCDDMILEWVDFPFHHGRLPFKDEKDIEVVVIVTGKQIGRAHV